MVRKFRYVSEVRNREDRITCIATLRNTFSNDVLVGVCLSPEAKKRKMTDILDFIAFYVEENGYLYKQNRGCYIFTVPYIEGVTFELQFNDNFMDDLSYYSLAHSCGMMLAEYTKDCYHSMKTTYTEKQIEDLVKSIEADVTALYEKRIHSRVRYYDELYSGYKKVESTVLE